MMFIRLPLLLLWVLASLLVLPFFPRARRWLCAALLRILSIDVQVSGKIVAAPALVVANHCSYLDVALLGAQREMCFTPKSDVRSWPLFGYIAVLFGSIFVNRSPSKAKIAQIALLEKLKTEILVCVFPEGTTNDGRHLLPFKSSLFSLVEASDNLPVQPITIKYLSCDGEPMNEVTWPQIAWYGDATFVAHFLGVLRFRKIKASLYIHEPIYNQVGEGRKELAARCFELIKDKL